VQDSDGLKEFQIHHEELKEIPTPTVRQKYDLVSNNDGDQAEDKFDIDKTLANVCTF